MEHLCPAGRSCQSCAAGIGKQVQHPYGAARRGHPFPNKVPVGRLLREYAGVLEVHGLDIKGQIVPVLDLPALRQMMVRPVSAPCRGTDIAGILLFPHRIAMRGAPDNLGVRANQDVFSPALQPLPVRGIQDLIILPLIRNPKHGFSPLFLSYQIKSSSEPSPVLQPPLSPVFPPSSGLPLS